jgi:hypothetical protein
MLACYRDYNRRRTSVCSNPAISATVTGKQYIGCSSNDCNNRIASIALRRGNVVACRGTEDHIVGVVSSLIDASATKRRRGESIKLSYKQSLSSSGYSAASLYSAPLQSSLCVRLCGLSCGRPCPACGTTFGLQHSVVVQALLQSSLYAAGRAFACGRACGRVCRREIFVTMPPLSG